MTWNEQTAYALIDQLILQGVDYFCIAPGNRSTPLVVAVSRHPQARRFVHFDERGLGFHALGYAKAARKPAAVIVTSGTAVGNLYPAVMEASYAHVPLILLTADRPAELRDVKANQTCDQVKIFGGLMRHSFDLPSPGAPDRMIATLAGQAVHRAADGPVQINCPFPEPFLGKEPAIFEPLTPCVYEPSEPAVAQSSLEKWAALLNAAQKGVILVGAHHSPYANKALFELARTLQWPILSDIISGVREEGEESSVVRYWDSILKNRPDWQADLVLHLGDQYVSKRGLEWAKSPILHVSSHSERCDPKHRVTHRLICDPLKFCEQILPFVRKKKSWLSEWKECEAQVERAFVQEDQLTEPGVFRALLESETPLFIGNSMPIRDADRFFYPLRKRGKIFANRGLSGIDGNIATCAGIADQMPLIAVMGDQTALHDLGSLAMLSKTRYPVTLIVINNGGGGIFSFVSALPDEELFAAAHNLTFEKAAALFNIPYTRDLQLGKRCLIEVRTDRKENVKVHALLDERIASCLSSCTVS